MSGEPCRVLPEDLELMPPGPALAAVLAGVDRRALSDKDRVRLCQARNRLASHVQGELLADMWAVSWDEPPPDPDFACRSEFVPYEWASTELAFALRWTATAAANRLAQAQQLVKDLPVVHAALCAGEIDMPKALVIAELVGWLDDPVTARRLVDKVIGKASGWTTGQLRARLRALVLAVDPDAARRRCVRAVRSRRVESSANLDGTGELWGRSLPAPDVAAVWERLTAIARAAKAAGDDRTIDQLRADALLDLLVGEGVATGGRLTSHHGGLPDTDQPEDADHPTGADHPTDVDRPTNVDHLSDVDQPTDVERLDTAGDNTSGAAGPAGHGPTGSDDGDDGSADTTPADAVAGRAGDGVPGDGQPAGERPGGFHDTTGEDDGWDPTWPRHPHEEVGPDQVWPHPTGEPVNWWDAAGRAFDGSDLWPCDWPGRWQHDPAVTAAAGNTPTSGKPCEHCGSERGPMPAPRRGVVELHIALSTLTGADDLPAELAGYGPLLADIARQTAHHMREATWRYNIYDNIGDLLHHGTTTKRPPPPTNPADVAVPPNDEPPPGQRRGQRRTKRRPTTAVAAYVRARNRTCIAPGCRRPARTCELDHTLAWAEHGETEPDNLGPGCERHHAFKHAPGTDLIHFGEGTFGWTTPKGMQYITKPDPPLYLD